MYICIGGVILKKTKNIRNILIIGMSVLLKPFVIICGYMVTSNSFPKPLSREEESEYLERYFNGDENARKILIERNLRLVAHIVKKYNNTGKESDDLISIGTVGLIKAISTFDASKKVRLATYAARCIENEILMNIRSTKKTKNEMSMNEPLGIDREGNEINLLDILGTESDEVLDKVSLKLETKELYKCIDEMLKDREKVIIQLRYGLIDGVCKTQREIASMLCISRSYVSRIETKALEKLNSGMSKK